MRISGGTLLGCSPRAAQTGRQMRSESPEEGSKPCAWQSTKRIRSPQGEAPSKDRGERFAAATISHWPIRSAMEDIYQLPEEVRMFRRMLSQTAPQPET